MRTPHPLLPTVLSCLALAIAVAGYVAPRPGAAEAATTTEPTTITVQEKSKTGAAYLLSTQGRVESLEGRADAVDALILRLQRDTAGLTRDTAALKTHVHGYTPMPQFGIVNVATLKQMLDRMAPSDVKATLPIAWDGVRLPSHGPQTGPPIAP